jgi:cytochrome c553
VSKVIAAAIGLVSIAAAVTAPAASGQPPAGAVACSGCHPASSRVSSPVVRLAGLDKDAIVRALQEFRAGTRAATVMDRIAKGFTDDEIQALAAWFAAQPKGGEEGNPPRVPLPK